jgi:hypothetical protein
MVMSDLAMFWISRSGIYGKRLSRKFGIAPKQKRPGKKLILAPATAG